MENYKQKIFVYVAVLAPLIALIFPVLFTVGKYMGLYPNINPAALMIYDLFSVINIAVGIVLVKSGIDEDGAVMPDKLKFLKDYFVFASAIHYNFALYLSCSRDIWAYAFMFVLISALLIDCKVVLKEECAMILSLVISCFIKGQYSLPAYDEFFVQNIILRINGVIISFATIYLLTYFVSCFLIKEIEKVSDYDFLTRLLNRRKMYHYLGNAKKLADGEGAPFCIVFFDLDNFKNINDKYGHDNGDEILKTFADIILHHVKGRDKVFRWGGEEFLALMFCPSTTAYMYSTKIIDELAKEKFIFDGHEVSITATGGIAQYKKHMSVDDVITEADKKLYVGKYNGKNQIVC